MTDPDPPVAANSAATSAGSAPVPLQVSEAVIAPALLAASAVAGDIPAVPIPHLDGCGCPGCGGMPTAPGRSTDSAADPVGGAALSAPAPLDSLADFLTTGFWQQFGTVPREFNLTGSGLNPKNGVLHYNVTGFTNAGNAGTDANGIPAARAVLVRDVLDVFSEVLGITFVETTSSDTGFTDLFFKDNASGAFANSAGFSSGVQYSYVNVASSWSGGTSTHNDYTLQTIFHEVGHALGLGHQGLYNGTGSYPSDADFDNDSWQATMMSYFSQTENSTIPASFAYLQTPMAVDWMALQDIYGDQSYGGTSFGTNNAFLGDTVYGFNTNIAAGTSRIWSQFATYAGATASTIVDAGGIDTLDFSGFSATQLINLAPTSRLATVPSVSNIGGLTGNLTLAEGTIIENAIGGSGADTFFGNAADNVFAGNAGNDTFHDSAGNDTYRGGAGQDTVLFDGLFSGFSFSISGTFLEVVNLAVDLVEDTVEWLGFDDRSLSFADVVAGLAGNSAPLAGNDAFATTEGGTLSGLNLLVNDTDADADALFVASVNGAAGNVGGPVTLASGALLQVNADGTFVYNPNGAFDGLDAGEIATDSFTYVASDGEAASAPATVTITVNGESAPAIGQSGVVTVAQAGPGQWHEVTFATRITDAVVVLGPATGNDLAPLTTRVRNVTDTGFEFQLDEWDYLDGVHGSESIGWLAVSAGTHRLAGGATIVAASTSLGAGPTPLAFGTALSNPVVLAELTSGNAAQALASRIQNVSSQGFEVQVQQQQSRGAVNQLSETLSWIAVEAGTGAGFEAFSTPDEVSDAALSYIFTNSFAAPPVLLADMQTTDGPDTSVTRLSALDGAAVSLFVEEEQSADSEVGHTDEVIGVVVLSGGLLYAANASPNAAPVAREDAIAVAENAALAIDVLANDTDADGDLLSVIAVAGQAVAQGDTVVLASGAQVTLAADGTLSYDQRGAFEALAAGDTASDAFGYTIADDGGATAAATVTVTIEGRDGEGPIAIGQSGRATVVQATKDQWHSVSFETVIADAVVVLGPVTFNGSDPVTTRVRKVTDTGFEFQIDEWDYLDGKHFEESVGWLALSAGTHELASGQTVVAAMASVGTDFTTIAFGTALDNPVVFAEVTSRNESDAVTTRIDNVTGQGFATRLQEAEAAGPHVPETVSWIAIESGGGPEALRSGLDVDDQGANFVFKSAFSQAPVLLADMQTTNGIETAALRLSALGTAGFTVFVEEERSRDAETEHVPEVVGFATFEDALIYLDSFLL